MCYSSINYQLEIRFNKIKEFHAVISQKVKNDKGFIIQKGYGDLWVKRPNKFNWHMIKPEEYILISDGTTLWIYNPIIKHVITMWLKDITNSILFMILNHHGKINCNQYIIKQNGNNFTFLSKNINNDFKKITINIDTDGVIHQINTVDQNNINNNYKLKLVNKNKINKSKFVFSPKYGISVDDHRVN